MGFWGSFVLCRPATELDDVAALTSRDGGVEQVARPAGRWCIGQGSGEALIDDADSFLRDLVAETGAPALLGYVMDSDTVDVCAYGAASGPWRACLDRDAMQRYLEDEPVDGRFLAPPAAVGRAMRWAADAGLTADEPALLDVFSRSGGDDPLAEQLFDELVDALGVNRAVASPPAARPTTAVRRARRPANPLDAFVAEYVADVLKDAGYAKKGRRFRRTNDRGDMAVVSFSTYSLGHLVDFHLEGAIVVPAIDEFLGWYHGTGPRGGSPMPLWNRRWLPPVPEGRPYGPDVWTVRDLQDRADVGRELRATVADGMVPTLAVLLDRPNLIDAVSIPAQLGAHVPMSKRAAAVVLLAEDGPAVALSRAIDVLVDIPIDAAALTWAHQTLAGLGAPDDSWRERVTHHAVDPYNQVDAVLREAVDDSMAAAGFVRSDLTYQRTTDRGDDALVEITVLPTASGEPVRFRVRSAVFPRIDIEWLTVHYAAVGQPANDVGRFRRGWLPTWHRPPAVHRSTVDEAARSVRHRVDIHAGDRTGLRDRFTYLADQRGCPAFAPLVGSRRIARGGAGSSCAEQPRQCSRPHTPARGSWSLGRTRVGVAGCGSSHVRTPRTCRVGVRARLESRGSS